MQNIYTHLNKPAVFRVVVTQAVITVLLSLGSLIDSRATALSALLGGLICLIPNAYLTVRAFSLSGARAAKSIVKEFYRGEAGKFVLTGLGFALAFSHVPSLHAVVLFSAFIVVQAVHWFAPLLLKVKAR
ncbi:ATP synthase subunit I [Sansalvadorimonas verongulae]|uniref:ATP synthase subunit I n=1 Tax=Sansalvadorimonas verongulae TaxID=2172824 RepID=UPI0012BD4AFA|nr:ATP synthase subunit I [Sansalvadorimonas verongulae]MTI12185.1 F0F1 ATP synthase subunit I [Sansalvadorimonas verongulae]